MLLRLMLLIACANGCSIQGYDSGTCMEASQERQDQMPFCAAVVTYTSCIPRYQGGSVTRWRDHTLRNKDQWVQDNWLKEFDHRKAVESNTTMQELGVDEYGNDGEPVVRFTPDNPEKEPINDCAQAYMNLFCFMNFPRCDDQNRSLAMCTSVCENYYKSCGYPKDMWRCGPSDLINGYEIEEPLLIYPGINLDKFGFDADGNQYFLRSFFPGQPFRDNQFEQDGETPIVICTPSLKNTAPTSRRPLLLLISIICILVLK